MYRLIALHVLGYMFCFGLVGLQIALDEVTDAAQEALTISITVPQPNQEERGERAMADGLAFYKVASTQEEQGFRSDSIPANLSRARDSLTAATGLLRTPSRLAEAYYLLGDTYLHGDFDPVRSERNLLRALELNENHFGAASSLAKCYTMMGLPIQASTAWERAIAAHPDDAYAHRSAALAYFQSPLPDRLQHAYDHAVTAIRLDASVKRDLEPILASGESPGDDLLGDGDAAPTEASLSDIIDRGHDGKLSDAEAERYAEEIGKLLQEK